MLPTLQWASADWRRPMLRGTGHSGWFNQLDGSGWGGGSSLSDGEGHGQPEDYVSREKPRNPVHHPYDLAALGRRPHLWARLQGVLGPSAVLVSVYGRWFWGHLSPTSVVVFIPRVNEAVDAIVFVDLAV